MGGFKIARVGDVTDDLYKVRLFVNQIGSAASLKLAKALKPKIFTEVKYEDIVKTCRGLFGVERNSIVEHFRFNNRSQNDGEDLGDFAVELQALAEHCEFGTFLDEALRDRFVAGMRNVRIMKQLLKMYGKTKFQEAVECAKREELLSREAGQMSTNVSESVNKIQGRRFEQYSATRGRGNNQSRIDK